VQVSSTSSFMIKTGGIVVRLGCLHDVSIPLPARTSPSNSANEPCILLSGESINFQHSEGPSSAPAPLNSPTTSRQSLLKHTGAKAVMKKTEIKTMAGELEVAVIPDHTHRLFVGQRTIVRFRLVG